MGAVLFKNSEIIGLGSNENPGNFMEKWERLFKDCANNVPRPFFILPKIWYSECLLNCIVSGEKHLVGVWPAIS